MKLSILMPVYNERDCIKECITKVQDIYIPYIDKEIIIVDDCSTDGTRKILKKIDTPRLKIIYHNINQGKGGAIKTALENATGDIVVIQDTDLEYDPMDLVRLVEPIRKGEAQVVYGSRFLRGGVNKFFLTQWIANKFLTWLTNILFGAHLTDMETCYKIMKRDIMNRLNIKSKRFEIEPEITTKLLKAGIEIKELPISFKCRTYSGGKKINWKDGVRALIFLLQSRFF